VREIRLVLAPARQRLRIAVTDAHPQSQPRPVEPHRPDRPRGHGLHFLSLLPTWGTVHNADGPTKTVWAEVPVHTPLCQVGR
jgi:hypothetical protein